MAQRAGVALGRLAYDADFSITRLEQDRHCPGSLDFSQPFRHKLVDGHTVEDILNTFHKLVGFDAKVKYNGFAVSIPISASAEQRVAFLEGNDTLSHDHLHSWVNGYARQNEQDVDLLFIDLAPGQVASQWANAEVNSGTWGYVSHTSGYTMLGDVGALNAQGVYDKLVPSIVPLGRKLHRVGILRPKGAFPDVYAADLETRFPDTPVKWLASDDLSYATAVVTSRQPTAYSTSSMRKNTTYLPIGIILANGKSVTVLPKDQNLPFEQKFIFATSQDNQRTVTARFLCGTIPIGEVTLEGLIPRTKGQAAIKVTISTDSVGHAGAIVEEVGTDLQSAQLIGDVIDWREYWNDSRNKAYEESADKQQVMTLERNGVIGALPE